MKLRSLATMLMLLASAGVAQAQLKYPPETRNAALRYWAAFAEMQDPPADKATQALLEKTASGEAAWDESKLGPIVDANAEAIETMQRATKLPECDWGLEYSLGPRASTVYVPRSRVLARLNTLEGMRQMAKGDSQAAVTAWLAGIRFSQDVARGGPLLFALVAKTTLLPNLNAITEGIRKGELNETQKQQVRAALKTLPEDGFDWGMTWGVESAGIDQFFQELREATNPGAVYEALMGKPAPKQGLPPTAQDIQAIRAYMLAVQAALREPPAKAKTLLDGLETKRHSLTEVEQELIPNPQKPKDIRNEIITARAELMRALAPQ